MRISLLLALVGLFIALIPNPSRAYEVEPLIIDLEPTGRGAATTIRVTNRDPVPVAVEIYAERRIIDEMGNETRERADDDFILVPPQVRVEAGETKTFRIRYIGEPVDRAVGYAVTVAQLQLENLEQTGVQVLVNFAASVHVVPRGARSDMSASEPTVSVAEDGASLVNFTIANDGARHQGMSRGQITLTNAAGEEYVVEGEELREAVKHTLFPAKATRNVAVRLPDGWSPNEAISVSLNVPGPV